MDLRMPVLDGVAATRRLAAAASTTVIALTTFDDDDSVFEALRAGAVGYLLKDVGAQRLLEAIRAAFNRESFLQPSIAAKVVAEFARLLPKRPAAVDILSERESAVLRLLVQGASNKEIAVQLRITEGTVKNHVTSIFSKLDVTDRTCAALKARELGIL